MIVLTLRPVKVKALLVTRKTEPPEFAAIGLRYVKEFDNHVEFEYDVDKKAEVTFGCYIIVDGDDVTTMWPVFVHKKYCTPQEAVEVLNG